MHNLLKKGYKLDDTDLRIIQLLSLDARTSYRSLGKYVGLSTNAMKARINRLIHDGIIQQFVTFVDLAILGYPRIYYLLIRNSDSVEETRSRIKLSGEIIFEIEGIGRIAVFGVAIKEDTAKDDRIQILSDALKPALVLSINIGRSKNSEKEVRETDLKILKCVLENPRMEISKISEKISISSKTVSARLERMKENHMIEFTAVTDPTKMGSYINFAILIRTASEFDQKTIFKEIHNELERHFLIMRLVMQQDNIITFALIAKSIFDIDPMIRKIKKIRGLDEAEVIIPSKIQIYQDWLAKEVDRLISIYQRNHESNPTSNNSQSEILNS
jgi:DNA-binding Lrp family transcriptional regulator